MKKYPQRFGAWGESVAEEKILAAGFDLVGKNVRTPYGEIDLIARSGETMIFFEVKTRSTDEFGSPEEALNFKKQEHLKNAVMYYLQEVDFQGEWRVDLIAVRGKLGQQQPEVEWFENVIG